MKAALPWWVTLSVFAILSLVSMQSHAATVISVDPVLERGFLRIAVITQEKVKFRYFTLADPARMVLHLPGTTLKSVPDTRLFKHPPLKALRHAIHNRSNLQLIFDLETPLDYRIESTFNFKSNQHQLIVIFESPEFAASPPRVQKIDSNKDESEQQSAVEDGTKSEDTIQIPVMAFDINYEKAAETEVQEPTNRAVDSISIADKLEIKSRIDMNGYGTFGILDYPKKSTKDSRRIDLGYKSTIGEVDFGVSMVKPVFFIETELNDTNIKFMIKEDDNSSGAAANLGVTLEW